MPAAAPLCARSTGGSVNSLHFCKTGLICLVGSFAGHRTREARAIAHMRHAREVVFFGQYARVARAKGTCQNLTSENAENVSKC